MIHDPILHRMASHHWPKATADEIHDIDCPCAKCEPYRPSHAPRLTAGDLGKHGLVGLAIGIATAIALDPAHAARSLLAIIGVGL